MTHAPCTLKTSFLLFAALVVIVLLSQAGTAHAASPAQDTAYYPPNTTPYGFVTLADFSESPKLRGAYNTTELGPFLQKVFVGAISLGAILAVLRLAYAGFVYMASDLWTSKEKAKEIITDTLLGLFLLLAIYLILKQINPQLLQLNINLGSAIQPGIPYDTPVPSFTTPTTRKETTVLPTPNYPPAPGFTKTPQPTPTRPPPLTSGTYGRYTADSIPQNAWCYENASTKLYHCFETKQRCDDDFPVAGQPGGYSQGCSCRMSDTCPLP